MSPILYAIEQEVRWRDLDAFNHVNNATYLGYVEEARVRWFKTLSGEWAEQDPAPILAAVTMNFRRPVGWPESLRIELFVERVGNKSVTVGHRILSTTQADLLYADGNAVMVWINREGRSVALPDDVRRACEI